MNPRLLAAAGAALMVLAGCSSSPDPDPTETTPATVSPPAPDAALAQYYEQQLQWRSCGGKFECTTMTVPLTYDEPDGETIEIDVLRSPAADPAKRLGSLVLNPGGPGGSGVEYARAARVVVTKPLLDSYDIVGFDPRGVADSTPIECLTDRQMDRFLNVDPNPETDEDVAATVAVSERFGQRCERNSPDLTPNIGTPFVARDMDILRELLGDERLNYLGKSYGTFIGATYADLFPGRVGRFVLDGAVDPTLTTADLSRGQAIGFEKALSRFAEWCADQKDCPIGDDPVVGVQKVADLLADLEENPLPADTGRPLTAAQATTGVVGSLYSAEDGWQSLFYALESAFKGDGFGLQSLADWLTERKPNGTYASNANEALYAVNCIDRPDRWDPEQTQQQAQEWSKEAPVFGAALAWGNLPCYYWPAPAVDEPREITAPGAPPIVVVGTEYDPATPYKWSVNLADQLDSGVLVSWIGGDGHTAYYSGSKCVDQAVDDFLVDGTVPDDGLECK
jgi:pimeloyl-ACP methyl ester carboxylesterase